MQPQRTKLRDYGERVVVARQLGVALGDGLVAPERRRGRGAASNESGRFEPLRREEFDDGWEPDETAEPFKTEVIHEKPRVIITRNQSPDISFDRSINPYRGCEHRCVYCFARPTHAYMGLSPGLDFETKLFVKDGAAALLERELAAPNYRPRTIAMGTNTDPYQPIERQYRITRSSLRRWRAATIRSASSPSRTSCCAILTSFAPMAARGLAKVYLSVTTLEKEVAHKMEPRAPIPARRLEAIERLAGAGVPVGVMVAPIVPAVNDAEIEKIPGARPWRRRPRGRLCDAAPAARIARHLPGMAPSPLSRQAAPHAVARAIGARRQGLQLAMGKAHGGLGTLRLDDRPPL